MSLSISSKRVTAVAAMLAALAIAPSAQSQPVVQQQNGIEFATGGVGQEEIRALDQIASRFNLKLVMTDTDGAYVGDVGLRIRVAQGYTILDTRTTGPLFYARLSPGEYSVEADFNGNVQTRKINVSGAGLQQLSFRWTAESGLNEARAPTTLPATSTTTGIAINPGHGTSTTAPARPVSPSPAISAPAQQGIRPPQAAGSTGVPAMRYAAGVAYLSGGVNADQQRQMENSGDRYNLKIKFQRTDDSVVLDVPTIITDAVGNEYLRGQASGPWLYVNLPPGVYRVAVRDFDRSQRARIQIYDNEVKHITFTWSPDNQSASTRSHTRATSNVSGSIETAVNTPNTGIPASNAGLSSNPGARTAEFPASSMPAEQVYQGIRYLSGGTGKEEEQAMRGAAAQYNLQITMARYGGDFVSDVSVRVIADNNTSILQVNDSGPLLFAKVPQGNYAIVATHNGVAKRQEVSIPDVRAKQVLFYW